MEVFYSHFSLTIKYRCGAVWIALLGNRHCEVDMLCHTEEVINLFWHT